MTWLPERDAAPGFGCRALRRLGPVTVWRLVAPALFLLFGLRPG